MDYNGWSMSRPSGKNSRTPEGYNPYQRPLPFKEEPVATAEVVVPKEDLITVLINKGADHISLVHQAGQLYIRSLDVGRMLGWALGKIDVILPTTQIENLKKGYLGRLRTAAAQSNQIKVGGDDSFVELNKAMQILQDYMSSDDRLQRNILPRTNTEKVWSSSELRTKFNAKLIGLLSYMRKTAAEEIRFRLNKENSKPRPTGRPPLR